MAGETDIYYWTDRAGVAYCRLRKRGGHWRLEWGHRQPPGGEDFMERGRHETSVQAEAVRLMLDRIRELSPEPDEAERAATRLNQALQETES